MPKTLKENLALAHEAIAYCKKHILASETSPDLSAEETRKIRFKVEEQRNRRIQLEEILTALYVYDDVESWLSLKTQVKGSKVFKYGNCRELASLALNFLRKHNCSAEIISMANSDHVFLALYRNENSNINEPLNWGENCVIVDPLHNKAYPCSEVYQHLQYFEFLGEEKVFSKVEPDDELDFNLSTSISEVNDLQKNKMLLSSLQKDLASIPKQCANILDAFQIEKISELINHIVYPSDEDLKNNGINAIERKLEKIMKKFLKDLANFLPEEIKQSVLIELFLHKILNSPLQHIYGQYNFLDHKILLKIIPHLKDLTDKNGNTLLHFAAYDGQYPEIKMLLAAGYHFDQKNKENKSASLYLCENLMREIKSIKNAADVSKFKSNYSVMPLSQNEIHSLIIRAIEQKQMEVIQFLLKDINHTTLNKIDEDGYALIHYAADANDKDILALIVEKGADIESKDDEDITALDVAVINEDLNSVFYLIKKGAVISQQTIEYAENEAVAIYLKNILARRSQWQALQKQALIYNKSLQDHLPLSCFEKEGLRQVTEMQQFIEQQDGSHLRLMEDLLLALYLKNRLFQTKESLSVMKEAVAFVELLQKQSIKVSEDLKLLSHLIQKELNSKTPLFFHPGSNKKSNSNDNIANLVSDYQDRNDKSARVELFKLIRTSDTHDEPEPRMIEDPRSKI